MVLVNKRFMKYYFSYPYENLKDFTPEAPNILAYSTFYFTSSFIRSSTLFYIIFQGGLTTAFGI